MEEAAAQAPQMVDLEVTVAQLSEEEGPIDPRAKKIHEKLAREFRYGSLTVIEVQQMHVAVDEIRKLTLPNGRTVRIRPLLLDDRGLLLAVDVEGVLQTDLRLRSGHLVVFGAHRFGSGKLVIAVEPRF